MYLSLGVTVELSVSLSPARCVWNATWTTTSRTVQSVHKEGSRHCSGVRAEARSTNAASSLSNASERVPSSAIVAPFDDVQGPYAQVHRDAGVVGHSPRPVATLGESVGQ